MEALIASTSLDRLFPIPSDRDTGAFKLRIVIHGNDFTKAS